VRARRERGAWLRSGPGWPRRTASGLLRPHDPARYSQAERPGRASFLRRERRGIGGTRDAMVRARLGLRGTPRGVSRRREENQSLSTVPRPSRLGQIRRRILTGSVDDALFGRGINRSAKNCGRPSAGRQIWARRPGKTPMPLGGICRHFPRRRRRDDGAILPNAAGERAAHGGRQAIAQHVS